MDAVLLTVTGDRGTIEVHASPITPLVSLVAGWAPRCSSHPAADLAVLSVDLDTLLDPAGTLGALGIRAGASVRLVTGDEATAMIGAPSTRRAPAGAGGPAAFPRADRPPVSPPPTPPDRPRPEGLVVRPEERRTVPGSPPSLGVPAPPAQPPDLDRLAPPAGSPFASVPPPPRAAFQPVAPVSAPEPSAPKPVAATPEPPAPSSELAASVAEPGPASSAPEPPAATPEPPAPPSEAVASVGEPAPPAAPPEPPAASPEPRASAPPVAVPGPSAPPAAAFASEPSAPPSDPVPPDPVLPGPVPPGPVPPLAPFEPVPAPAGFGTRPATPPPGPAPTPESLRAPWPPTAPSAVPPSLRPSALDTRPTVPAGSGSPDAPAPLPERVSGRQRFARALKAGLSRKAAPTSQPGEFAMAAAPKAGERYRLAMQETDRVHNLEAMVRAAPLRRCVVIAVVSPKGGAGKTTMTALLGTLLAELRRDPVLALDANPDFGNLRDKLASPGAEVASTDNLSDWLAARPNATPAELSSLLGAGPHGLRYLPTPTGSIERMVKAADFDLYRNLIARLRDYEGIILVDCGTGLLDPPVRAALATADQIVLVTDSSADTARLVVTAAQYLPADTPTWLVANKMPDKGAMVDLDQVAAAIPQLRGLTVVPEQRLSENIVTPSFDWSTAPDAWKEPVREVAARLADNWRLLR